MLILRLTLSMSLLNYGLIFFFSMNKELVESLSRPNSDAKDISFPTKYSQSFLSQYLTCIWKQNLSYWRNPQYTAVRFFYTVIISMMFGTICWNFGSKRYCTNHMVRIRKSVSLLNLLLLICTVTGKHS